tara:strand:- start:593 stop:955 length:363 start_codon:yes stop_codon:yes gene_type:complete
MKKLITILASVILSFGLFAQNAEVKGDEASLKEDVASGNIEIIFPESTKAEDIEKSAEYYVDYFTVDYNAETRLAKITMVDNTSQSRRVIKRLLLSNNVRTIDFNGESYSINDFHSKYID